MAYLFYWVSFLFLLTATVLYATRHLWLQHAPPIPYLTAPGPIPEPLYNLSATVRNALPFGSQRYTRLASFAGDAEAGFSSASFNLAENIEAGDSRAGLDERGKREVQRIMKEKRVGFDEARRMLMEERFGKERIGRDGRPLDPKAVFFDRV